MREREGNQRFELFLVPMLGNILEENQMVAKFSGQRSASPLDEKGRVICHTPGTGAEEETSSEDTGGQVCLKREGEREGGKRVREG